MYLNTVCKVSKYQPDSNEIHLVERIRKLDLYQGMLETLKHIYKKDEMPSQETFYQVWKHEYPHLKIPKHYHICL
jgi:hypothetical protein